MKTDFHVPHILRNLNLLKIMVPSSIAHTKGSLEANEKLCEYKANGID